MRSIKSLLRFGSASPSVTVRVIVGVAVFAAPFVDPFASVHSPPRPSSLTCSGDWLAGRCPSGALLSSPNFRLRLLVMVLPSSPLLPFVPPSTRVSWCVREVKEMPKMGTTSYVLYRPTSHYLQQKTWPRPQTEKPLPL